ncbi:thioredoxin 1-like [Oscarella lobularis]|uniref:thioredoxin 1-like n=1 Tax=Oscarella lobularis TaxID=121494 RepID=UPI003314470F
MSGIIKQIESMEDLNAIVQQSGSKLVIVDFYADWCGPCKRIAPVFEAMVQKEFEGKIDAYKVNADEVEEAVDEYEVSGLPTFKFFKNGENIDVVVGGNEDELREKIQNYV